MWGRDGHVVMKMSSSHLIKSISIFGCEFGIFGEVVGNGVKSGQPKVFEVVCGGGRWSPPCIGVSGSLVVVGENARLREIRVFGGLGRK